MIGELDLNGIFLPPALVSAVAAILLLQLARRALIRMRAYRFVWHPALFDAALFVILWAGVSALPLPH